MYLWTLPVRANFPAFIINTFVSTMQIRIDTVRIGQQYKRCCCSDCGQNAASRSSRIARHRPHLNSPLRLGV